MAHRIQILHLISSNSFMGAERVVAELACATCHQRHHMHVAVMTNNNAVEQAFESAMANGGVSFVRVSSEAGLIGTLLQVAMYVKEAGIRIIHSHGYKSDVYASLIRLFSARKINLVASSHGWLLNTRRESLYKKIDLLALRLFDSVSAIKKEIVDELQSSGVKRNKITIIDNGISLSESGYDVKAFHRAALGFRNNDLVVGCIARLSKEKAQSDLVDAFSRLCNEFPSLRLLLVGDGPCLGELKERIGALKIEDRVVLTGFRQDARDLYHTIDIFALVSLTEGLPMAVLEAMAAKRAVVASRVGAIPEIIEDGVNGLLVEPQDICAIATALSYLVKNPQKRSTFGDRGRETVVARYGSDRMAREYERLYQEVVTRS